jgi:hypothetical protein
VRTAHVIESADKAEPAVIAVILTVNPGAYHSHRTIQADSRGTRSQRLGGIAMLFADPQPTRLPSAEDGPDARSQALHCIDLGQMLNAVVELIKLFCGTGMGLIGSSQDKPHLTLAG